MRIGMILDQRFPPDIRVENEAVSLLNGGYEVFIFCYTYSEKTEKVNYRNIELRRISTSRYWVKKMRGLVNVVPAYEIYLNKKIIRFVEENEINVLHVHDLYLLGICLKVRDKLKIPIVSDLHENYVEGLQYYDFANKFPGKLLININNWKKKERKWLEQVDKIIVVVEEAVDRLRKIGIAQDKISTVPNYLNFADFDRNEIKADILEKFQKNFLISYIGAFDHHRGINILIKAFAEFLEHYTSARLLLVGHGKIYNQLNRLAESLNIKSYVTFMGYQPGDTISSYIEASHLGVIPHLRTGHTNATLPHKLFQYMYKEKPVIVSDCDPLRRIVNEAGCGKVYDNQDPSSLAAALLWCYQNREELTILGRKGRDSVLRKYNWTMAEKNLLSVYEKFKK